MADELTFWNRQLSDEEVEAIRDMYPSWVLTFLFNLKHQDNYDKELWMINSLQLCTNYKGLKKICLWFEWGFFSYFIDDCKMKLCAYIC